MEVKVLNLNLQILYTPINTNYNVTNPKEILNSIFSNFRKELQSIMMNH